MKIVDFSVIFCRVEWVGRSNDPTSEPNMVGLVEIYLLFTRKVSGFDRIQFRTGRVDRVGKWIEYLHNLTCYK